MKTLYDGSGRPISTDHLQEEVAAPVDFIRQIWTEPVADKLTPAYLAQMIRRARDGDAHEFLTLADDMEEREPHYGSVLRTRKLAVSGLTPQVKPGKKKDARAKEIAEAVEDLIEEPEFGDLVSDLLDSLGKGYSACEIMWETTSNIWKPSEYKHRDPRFFRFDNEDGEKLKLLDKEDSMIGIELPKYKFIVHYPRLKTGLKITSGLARLAAASYMCKTYTIKDMMRFIEVFGMPLRVGKYKPGATKGDIATLRRAVVNLGYDASAVMPDSMKVEFIEAAGGGSSNSNPFTDIADWFDSQISKAVLGQTMTTDGGSSYSQSKTHNEVRMDIKADDARKLANTINKELIEPYVDLNYGKQERYPKVYFPVEDSADLEKLANALGELIPMGLKVSQPWVRSQLGAPAPDDDEELMVPPATGEKTPGPGDDDTKLKPEKNREESATTTEDELDEIAAKEFDDWEPKMKPILDPVMQALLESSSYEEFLAKIPGLTGEMDATKIIESLALAGFKARGLGDAKD